MNVGTGACKPLDLLTDAERASGEWVPVSDVVVDRLHAGEALESLAAERDESLDALVAEIKAGR